MEYTDDQEQLLSLGLAVVTDSASTSGFNKEISKINPDEEHHQAKIFRLLQTRDQMLQKQLGGHNQQKRNTTIAFEQDEAGSRTNNNIDPELIHLLLITAATAIDENNTDAAVENLCQLYQTVALSGNSSQRVAAYFTDALAAGFLTRKSPFYEMLMREATPDEELLAFTNLYRVSPFYQFAHFTANQAIIEAFENEEHINNRALHVIDFDISYGFQWPSLLQSLSEKAAATTTTSSSSGGCISLKITGFGRSLEELRRTETRLVGFANGVGNVVFEFQGILQGSKLMNLKRKKYETVAVNLVFYLNTLNYNPLKISEILQSVRFLNPSIVFLVEQEGTSYSPRRLSPRFMESFHFFAAMFDSLDDCLPVDSPERLSIERNYLGKEIKSMIKYDDYCPRYERMEIWKGRMEGHGFEGVRLSSKAIIQAKLLLKIGSHYRPVQFDGECSGFRVFERDEGKALSLGWQDKCLITASAWLCV